jgi:outer membrane protein assembly factor BamB
MEKGIRKVIISLLALILLYSTLAVSASFRAASAEGSGSGQMGPRMNHLQLKFYSNQSALFTGLLNGEVDLMDAPLTKAQYQEALGDSNILLGPIEELNEYDIAFNNNATDPSHNSYRKAMNYTEFRQAMACLIDKDGLVNGTLLNGFGERVDTPVPRPIMDNWVNFNVSKYASDGSLLNNYPWDYNETHALQILWTGGWYNHTSYPTLSSLLAYFSSHGSLPMGSVVYPLGHPKAGQPIDSIVAYIRSNDQVRKQAGEALVAEMTKLGINSTVNEGDANFCRVPVFNNHDFDFYTAGWGLSSLPTYFYSTFTPAGIYSGGPNIYLISDANLTQQATLECPNATSIAQSMNAALACQNIIVQQAMLVPLYTVNSHYAYRKGLLGVVPTKGYGLEGLLDLLTLNTQHQNYPTVNTIRYGTMSPPEQINPIFGGWGWEGSEATDRIFTGYMNTNPYKSTSPGKSPAGGDLPWMAYDWKYEQGPNGNAIVTLWFNQSIKWHDGAPLIVDDLNYTIYLQQAYGDSWDYADFIHIVNFTKIDDYTCKLYFDSPSIYNLYTCDCDIVPEHIYKYIAVPANASSGTSTTGHHGEWPGKNSNSSEILPGAPFTWSQLTGADGGKYTWVGTNMWKYQLGTYTGGAGGGMTLDANRNFFLYTPPAGEIDFQYYWNSGLAPQTGCYKVDLNDLVLMNIAYGSIGNPPSTNWNPACNIAAPSGLVNIASNVTLEVNYGVRWGYFPAAITFQPSTRYPWPMFRHDLEHTGYTESPAPNTNQTTWNYTTGGEVYSSPAAADGRVYVGCGGETGVVYCLDALSGTQIWNYTTNGGVVSCPALAGGNVYVGWWNSIYCLDALNGTRIWSYPIGGTSVHSSAAVVDGEVYVGSEDGWVYCLDAVNGTQLWSYTTGGPVRSSPALANGEVYVGSGDNRVYCLDALSGTRIWSYTAYAPVYSSPAVADGRVYVGSEDYNIYCLDAVNGTQLWSYTTGGPVRSSPALANGRVYVGSDDGVVYCLDALNGTQIWNYTTKGGVESSPAVTEGKVYLGSMDSTVYCLNALSGTVTWSYKTGNWVESSPAVADGMVFVGSNDGLVYAFGSLVETKDYSTVQAAVNAAAPGATVIVAKGIYSDTLSINKTLTILGEKGSYPVWGGGGSGIYLTLWSGASGSIVTGIAITNYNEGILVVNASGCQIHGNIMASMVQSGIELVGNTATGNLIYNNVFQDMPTAVNLTASATGNTIYKNIISSQTTLTINLQTDTNNVYENDISGNQVLVNMTDSNGNVIYHNNFMVTVQVSILTTGSNTWDDGYPLGGNYWSNSVIVDLYSGPYQNLTGSDGINDTAFTINANNKDRYPLTKPFDSHDIGVVNATLSKTIVGKGYPLLVSSIILNYGVYDENTKITVYGNTTAAAEQPIFLPERSPTTISTTWNTLSFAYGNYTLSVYAWPVPNQTDTTGNNLTIGTVKVTIPGDLNGDFKVNLADLTILAGAYGTRPGDAKWKANADIDGNGAVGLVDLTILAYYYQQHYP